MERDEDTTRRARENRKEPSPAEKKLWAMLCNRRLIMRKFRREHPIGPWVADFACPAVHLVIELDGPSHDSPDQQQWDQTKAEYLRTSGWRVLRITNAELFNAPGEVRAKIIAALGD